MATGSTTQRTLSVIRTVRPNATEQDLEGNFVTNLHLNEREQETVWISLEDEFQVSLEERIEVNVVAYIDEKLGNGTRTFAAVSSAIDRNLSDIIASASEESSTAIEPEHSEETKKPGSLVEYLKKHELLGRWKFSNNRLTLMDSGGDGVIASWDSTTRHVMGILQSLGDVADQQPEAGKPSVTMLVAKGELELEDEAKLSYDMAIELVYQAGEIVERVLKIEPAPPEDKNHDHSSVNISTKDGATLFVPSEDGMEEIQLKDR